MAITNVGESQSFSYTGNVQTFTAPFSGVYKFDIKGGSAGSGQGGQGGTSIGYKLLKKGDIVFVCVGGAGNAAGAYNGGGTGVTYEYPNWTTIPYCCGGGATHIALVTGTLAAIGAANIDKILIVAGGGGGNYYNVTSGVAKGGNGGGLIGGYGVDMGEDGEIEYYGSPGTQIGLCVRTRR